MTTIFERVLRTRYATPSTDELAIHSSAWIDEQLAWPTARMISPATGPAMTIDMRNWNGRSLDPFLQIAQGAQTVYRPTEYAWRLTDAQLDRITEITGCRHDPDIGDLLLGHPVTR